MRGLFLDLFKEMNQGDWLWDGSRYDVKITERYIEAIADFYDYYNEYEKTYAAFDDEKQKAIKAEQDNAKLKIAEIEAKHRAEEERLRAELLAVRQDAANQYAVETAMRKLIDERAIKAVIGLLEKVIEGNGEKLPYKEDDMPNDTQKLNALVPRVLYSYIYRIIEAREGDKKSANNRSEKVRDELNRSLLELLDALCNGNAVSAFLSTLK